LINFDQFVEQLFVEQLLTIALAIYLCIGVIIFAKLRKSVLVSAVNREFPGGPKKARGAAFLAFAFVFTVLFWLPSLILGGDRL
jgi:hypothetical protein